MFAIVQNGVVQMLIPAGTAFTWNDVNYPANWIATATQAELAALGIVDVVYGPQANDQYYWVSQDAPVYNQQTNQVDINFTATPKDLASVKSNSVSSINAQAYSILQPTDWLVIRATESGGVTPVPATWNTWRANIRKQASDAVTAINAATSVDVVAAIFPIAWAPSPDTPTNK